MLIFLLVLPFIWFSVWNFHILSSKLAYFIIYIYDLSILLILMIIFRKQIISLIHFIYLIFLCLTHSAQPNLVVFLYFLSIQLIYFLLFRGIIYGYNINFLLFFFRNLSSCLWYHTQKLIFILRIPQNKVIITGLSGYITKVFTSIALKLASLFLTWWIQIHSSQLKIAILKVILLLFNALVVFFRFNIIF